MKLFLEIPYDIHYQIYEELLIDEAEVLLYRCWKTRITITDGHCRFLHSFRSCRTIYEEASPILYRKKYFAAKTLHLMNTVSLSRGSFTTYVEAHGGRFIHSLVKNIEVKGFALKPPKTQVAPF